MKKTMFLLPGRFCMLLVAAIMFSLGASAQEHPAYLHALSDLRAARWLIDHRPGNWQQSEDEAAAVRAIDAAMNEIKKAAIDDGKNLDYHPQVQDIQDRAGRIQKAIELLKASRADIAQREDDRFAQGLRGRAFLHIDEAIDFANRAVGAGHQGAHPAYLQALSNLRAARWLIDHRPGNWQQSQDEASAVRAIDASMAEITKAAIDDGKNLNDHPQVQDIQDRVGRIQKALELLKASRADIAQREDDGFAQGLRGRAFMHIDEAINFANRAVAAGAQGQHPAYLQALSNLRAARWLIDHRPGNWQQSEDEAAAVRAIDASMNEITKAAIDDGKNLNDHPQVQDIQDRAGRIQKALELLKASRADIAQREDDGFAQGLRERAFMHIDEAINFANRAVAAGAQGQHPAYLHALADLRAARWLIDHRSGNWQQSQDEGAAVRAIDAAINEIKRAAIDDGKDINDHAQAQEIPDRGGRLRKAIEMLRATRGDVSQREDDGFAQGLKARAIQHVDEAIRFVDRAIQSR